MCHAQIFYFCSVCQGGRETLETGTGPAKFQGVRVAKLRGDIQARALRGPRVGNGHGVYHDVLFSQV